MQLSCFLMLPAAQLDAVATVPADLLVDFLIPAFKKKRNDQKNAWQTSLFYDPSRA